jgi:hypothetical protein
MNELIYLERRKLRGRARARRNVKHKTERLEARFVVGAHTDLWPEIIERARAFAPFDNQRVTGQGVIVSIDKANDHVRVKFGVHYPNSYPSTSPHPSRIDLPLTCKQAISILK